MLQSTKHHLAEFCPRNCERQHSFNTHSDTPISTHTRSKDVVIDLPNVQPRTLEYKLRQKEPDN